MRLIGALTLLIASAACSPITAPDSGLNVVTTTTVLADLVASVGGERVSVTALVPKGGEAHTFDPAPSDAAKLEGAELIIMNGLGLDDWLRPFAESAGAGDIPVMVLTDHISATEYHFHDDNPHLWLDPDYAVAYSDHIARKLTEIDPAGAAIYENRLNAYTQELWALGDWAKEQFESVPLDQRRVVSFHDAFPYFAARYSLDIVDVVVAAPGQEPTAAEVARLIQAIRTSGARAILAEAQFSDELTQTISDETGVQVVHDLYTDSLGDPPLDSYIGIMRWNVQQIVEALR